MKIAKCTTDSYIVTKNGFEQYLTKDKLYNIISFKYGGIVVEDDLGNNSLFTNSMLTCHFKILDVEENENEI